MSDLTPNREGFVTEDGHRIHYEYFGRGDREVICLLNGLAMRTKAWYGFLPRLLPELDVVLYDYPGQGASSAHDVPYFIPRIAAYQDLSLRFYRGGPEAFNLYTHYMYEKIFGESFVQAFRDQLEPMRVKFYDRYKDKMHCLIRLTEAQNPFFESLDDHLAGYRAIRTPVLIMAGAEDRAIPPWVQKKLTGILPNVRFEPVEESGHVVYLEKPKFFFGNLLRFTRAKSVDF
jgi:pimeloyl-ACP methyl ester carboxylesterase